MITDKSTYLDPWRISAKSLVIFPDSTTPIQAASSFSVKSKSVALSSSFALSTYTPFNSPVSQLYYFEEFLIQWINLSTELCTLHSNYLWARPLVQAKMDAMLFVLVSPPFWWTLKWRVTVPWAASASMVFPSGQTWNHTIIQWVNYIVCVKQFYTNNQWEAVIFPCHTIGFKITIQKLGVVAA